MERANGRLVMVFCTLSLTCLGLAWGAEPAGQLAATRTSPPPALVIVATVSNHPPVAAKPAPAPPATEKLLLLDDTPETKPVGVEGADNSRCQVCHLNFMTELLAVSHATNKVGCAECHGPCDEHIADESWASGGNGTAPTIMFPRPTINVACVKCHKAEKVIYSKNHKPDDVWLMAFNETVCTDCHGKHRMVKRRCQWK
jgi:hypothetical protein